MIPYSFTHPHPITNLRIPLRIWTGIASAVLIALAVACFGAPTPTFMPTPTPAPASATLRTTGLIVNEPEAFEGYTLFTPLKSGVVYLIDNHGRVVHEWTMEPGPILVKLLDDGNLLTNNNRMFDADGNAVWNYRHHQHHDLLKMPNGNILILAHAFIPSEEAITLGADPDLIACPALRATHIVEVRPTGPRDGEIVWEWSVGDHLIQDFDPEKPNYGVVADHPERVDINFTLAQAGCQGDDDIEWLHSNALDYNPELDQIMITVRHFSEIWVIDHSTSVEEAAGRAGGNSGKGGDLLYRWGNPRAYRRGTAADQRLFWPHSGHWIPEGLPGAGNVLIFNNGNEYPGFERGYSSADEIAIPADGFAYRLDNAPPTNEVVWRYAADPRESFYAPVRSNAQRLPNGNTLITSSPKRIFEVTRDGKTVWEFVNPLTGVDALYRSYRYAPDYPGLQGIDLTAYRAAVTDEPPP